MQGSGRRFWSKFRSNLSVHNYAEVEALTSLFFQLQRQPHFNFKVEVRLKLKLRLNENEVEGSKIFPEGPENI